MKKERSHEFEILQEMGVWEDLEKGKEIWK